MFLQTRLYGRKLGYKLEDWEVSTWRRENRDVHETIEKIGGGISKIEINEKYNFLSLIRSSI